MLDCRQDELTENGAVAASRADIIVGTRGVAMLNVWAFATVCDVFVRADMTGVVLFSSSMICNVPADLYTSLSERGGVGT
jgi:hypothetical protein